MNTPRRRRLPRILLANVAVVLVSPIVLLHILSFLFSSHDRSMKPLALRIVTDSSGHTLRCYELKHSDAEWDILFIHRKPATAAVFGEQFRRPFPRANLAALDRPGFGASSPDRHRPSLEDQANAVGALLRNKPKTMSRRSPSLETG